ncbi:PAS domain-containing protein [Marivibrio halodurans]|uniref:histidine kinase n=1 Tax=Marivibrio halodurans TaxID=2039722 RepID=A0A8J7SJE1_9PROT|nr:ATP-binding protein [Marivibrio halodurans]MBP5855573.1 PAS domain-containing protein [Marivibrio halodurans]
MLRVVDGERHDDGGDGRGADVPPARPSADAVLDALPEPVLVVDGQDNAVYLNGAAESFFAGSRATLLGTNLQILIPHDSPLLALVAKVRRTGSSMTEYGVQLQTPRIGKHVLSIDAAPIADVDQGVVITLKEHTIAGKIDDVLTQRGAARSVSALSAMLAHEVKNPLSGIRGAAQLLESMVAGEDRALTQLIKDETDRIVKLVGRMEVFSDRPPLEREPVNIHEVLDRVLQLGRTGFGRDLRLAAEYDPSLPPVYGDKDQLVQVFLNLVKNAAEALQNAGTGDGEIVVKTAFRHGVRLAVPGLGSRMHLPLVVTVRDNGPGIPEDIRRHLFDPFITTKQGGTGLGLALAAKLIGDHGGVIDVESRPRRTVFSVMLPMLRAGTIPPEGAADGDLEERARHG